MLFGKGYPRVIRAREQSTFASDPQGRCHHGPRGRLIDSALQKCSKWGCANPGKSEGPRVPSNRLPAARLPPDSQTSARRVKGAARGEGSLQGAEERKPWSESGFSRLRPTLGDGRPPVRGSGGPAPPARPRRGGASPAPTPREACRLSTQIKWQRRLRHGAPRSNPRPGSGSGAGPPPRQATRAILRKSGSRDSAVLLSLSIHFSEDPQGFTYSVFVVGIRLGR